MIYSKLSGDKIACPVEFTKYLLCTHPIQLITTIGKVNEKLMTNVAPFATCLDTSYNPPYVTFAVAVKQHTLRNRPSTRSKMNTYLNIKQNGLFIVNTPPRDLIKDLNTLSYPYKRTQLKDKIALANLTKLMPFILSRERKIYPPLIKECLVHLECKVIEIHRPKGSDHYLITGKVLAASYNKSLGKDIDKARLNLIKRIFHHFGSSSKDYSIRFIGKITPDFVKTIPFKLEAKFSGKKGAK